MLIKQIYKSIQCEGYFQGAVAVFVELTDDVNESIDMPPVEVLSAICGINGYNHVVFNHANNNIAPLLKTMHAMDMRIHMEVDCTSYFHYPKIGGYPPWIIGIPKPENDYYHKRMALNEVRLYDSEFLGSRHLTSINGDYGKAFKLIIPDMEKGLDSIYKCRDLVNKHHNWMLRIPMDKSILDVR
jgi:hypothetical protein